MTAVDVCDLRACKRCSRLVCDDWETCPGQLRDLVDRMAIADAEREQARLAELDRITERRTVRPLVLVGGRS